VSPAVSNNVPSLETASPKPKEILPDNNHSWRARKFSRTFCHRASIARPGFTASDSGSTIGICPQSPNMIIPSILSIPSNDSSSSSISMEYPQPQHSHSNTRENIAKRMKVLILCHNNHSHHSVVHRQLALAIAAFFVSPSSTEEVRVGGTTLYTIPTTTTTLNKVLLSWIHVPTTTRHHYCRQDQETETIISRLPVVMTLLQINFHRFKIYEVSLKRRKNKKQ